MQRKSEKISVLIFIEFQLRCSQNQHFIEIENDVGNSVIQ